jgi:hypothetical protein
VTRCQHHCAEQVVEHGDHDRYACGESNPQFGAPDGGHQGQSVGFTEVDSSHRIHPERKDDAPQCGFIAQRDTAGPVPPPACSEKYRDQPRRERLDMTDRPATRSRVTATIGASAISTIRAPASTVMARAPMATQ